MVLKNNKILKKEWSQENQCGMQRVKNGLKYSLEYLFHQFS